MKVTVILSFSRSAYVSEIQTPTREDVNVENEVEVLDTKDCYKMSIIAND